MADPRDKTDFTNIGYRGVTKTIDNSTIVYDATKINGSASAGLAVKLSAAGAIVALVQDGDPVDGVLVSVEDDNFCTVQVEGFATLPGGASATITQNLKFVGALGASSARGYIRAIAPATLADVAAGRGRIVDPTTSTAVVVEL